MNFDKSAFVAANISQEGNPGAVQVKQSIKTPLPDAPADGDFVREHEDVIPASYWDSESGSFLIPPSKPPSRRAETDAQVQAMLAARPLRPGGQP